MGMGMVLVLVWHEWHGRIAWIVWRISLGATTKAAHLLKDDADAIVDARCECRCRCGCECRC